MEGGAWKATVHGVAKSQTRLSDFTLSLSLYIHISGEAQGEGLPLLEKQHFGEGKAQGLTAELGPQHPF